MNASYTVETLTVSCTLYVRGMYVCQCILTVNKDNPK